MSYSSPRKDYMQYSVMNIRLVNWVELEQIEILTSHEKYPKQEVNSPKLDRASKKTQHI